MSTANFTIANRRIVWPSGAIFNGLGLNLNDNQMSVVVNASKGTPLTSLFPGIQMVRVACNGYDDPTSFDSFVTTVTALNIIVLIEHHPWPQLNALTGSDLTAQTNWLASMATHFKGNILVWLAAGQNEPQGGNIAAEQQAGYTAIRNTGNNNLIALESLGGGNPGSMGGGYAGIPTNSYASMSGVFFDLHFYQWVVNFFHAGAYANDTASITGALFGTSTINQGSYVAGANTTGFAGLATYTSLDGAIPIVIGETGPGDGNSIQSPQDLVLPTVVAQQGYPALAWAWEPSYPLNLTQNNNALLSPWGTTWAPLVAAIKAPGNPVPTPTPVVPTPTPTPTAKTRAGLISYLATLAGNHAISGQFYERNAPGGDGSYAEAAQIKQLYGQTPGVAGFDFYYDNANLAFRADTAGAVAGAKTQWDLGGLVTVSCEFPNPVTGNGAHDASGNNILTNLINPSFSAYNTFRGIMDDVAAGLKAMQDYGIIVIHRPFHESVLQGSWWWDQTGGNPTAFKNFWQYYYNYMTVTKGLTNMVWLYSSGSFSNTVGSGSNILDRVPYAGQADMIGQDSYTSNLPGQYQQVYNDMTTSGLVICMSEFGSGDAGVPDDSFDQNSLVTAMRNNFPKNVYWMNWGEGGGGGWGLLRMQNVSAALANSWTLNAGQMSAFFTGSSGGGTPTPTPVPPGIPLLTTTSGGSFQDSHGFTYTLSSGGVFQKNGVETNGGAGTSQATYVNSIVWALDGSSLLWYQYDPIADSFGSPTSVSPIPTTGGGFTPSPNGTVIVGAGNPLTITDANGNVWAITAGGQVIVTPLGGSPTIDQTTNGVDELAWISGLIWHHSTLDGGLWWHKSSPSDTWAGGTSTSPIGNAPVASPDGTIVSTAGPAIVDSNGNLWTLKLTTPTNPVVGFSVYVNGQLDPNSGNTAEIAFVSNVLWKKDNNQLWQQKVLSNDTWTPVGGTLTGPFSTGGGGNPDVVTGTGANQFILKMSGDAFANGDGSSDIAGDPAFKVSLDGSLLSANNYITTASHALSAVQNFVFNGTYSTAQHIITVNYVNDAITAGVGDRQLYVNDIIWEGASTGLNAQLQANGPQNFTIAATPTPTPTPPTPTPTPSGPAIPALPGKTIIPPDVTTGTGSDQLVIGASSDAYANGDGTSDAAGNAKFSLTVDGITQGTTFIAAAAHSSSQYEQFIFNGTFGVGTHTVAVSFLNNADDGSSGLGHDRNLYVDGVIYQGLNTNQSSVLYANGTSTFTVTGTSAPTPTPPTPTPTPAPPISGNTWNIHTGIRTWAAQEVVQLGDIRQNNGIAYECVTPGVCGVLGAGPTGTGSNIVDNSAHWRFLSNVDFFATSGAVAQLPSQFSADLTFQYWNEANQTTTAGVPFFTLQGHNMYASAIGGFSSDFSSDFAGGSASQASYNLILTAAAGFGIRDSLATESRPLQYDGNRGVAFLQPLTATTTTSYAIVNDPSVIIDGLQFKDPLGTSDSIMLSVLNTNTRLIVRNCIFDGASQQGGAFMFFLNSSGSVIVYNCLIIDRMASTVAGIAFRVAQGVTSARFVNCTFVAVNSPTNGVLFSSVSGFTGGIVKNCGIFGYGATADANWTFDHCVTDKANFGSGVDGGNNIFSSTAAANFRDPTADWSLLPTSPMIDHAIIDTIDIPSSDDIARLQRGQGPAWDVGCWEAESYGVREDKTAAVEIWNS